MKTSTKVVIGIGVAAIGVALVTKMRADAAAAAVASRKQAGSAPMSGVPRLQPRADLRAPRNQAALINELGLDGLGSLGGAYQ
ncbi:MAG: hypothetical protein ABIO35_10905 [Nitrobacter sp.]